MIVMNNPFCYAGGKEGGAHESKKVFDSFTDTDLFANAFCLVWIWAEGIYWTDCFRKYVFCWRLAFASVCQCFSRSIESVFEALWGTDGIVFLFLGCFGFLWTYWRKIESADSL